MMKEDLIRKLSSRKFWAMLASLAVCVCAFFALPDVDVAKITALIGAFGNIAVYMLSEALVDSANSTKSVVTTEMTTNTTENKTFNTQIQKHINPDDSSRATIAEVEAGKNGE